MTTPLRCPSCGREDVDRIVHGLVDPTAAMEHVRFGGCLVLPWQPDFHCTNCGNEWAADDSPDGRQRPTAEGEPDPYDDLHAVQAWIRHADGSWVEVTIDLRLGLSSWTGRTSGPDGETTSASRQLSPTEAEAFGDQLRTIDPLRWKGRYHAACVVDGTTWGVRIVTAARTSRRAGINAGPRAWAELQELAARLTGRPFGVGDA